MADPRVFISYARSDGEAFATRLRKRLEKSHPEITLWQDRARMEGGVGWWNQITEALDKVRFMVLVMTPAALASPIVQKEWRYARQQGVCVYPVKGVPGKPLDFGAMPKWMSNAHFFDLKKEWTTFVNHLKSDRRAPRVPFMAPDLPAGFVERPREFDQLRALLLDVERKDPVAITTALQGAGGFGKTTLAAALCHDEDVITAYRDGILWTTLGEQPNVLDGLAKIHAALTGEDPGFRDVEQAGQRLADRLEDRCALLVIDDVWNDAHLSPFLRGAKGCARLITTRQRTIAVRARCRAVTVDEMSDDEAIPMLTGKMDATPLDREPFRILTERLGAWPLMIDLAGAAIQERIALGDSVAGAMAYVHWGLEEGGVSAFRRDDADERHQSIARALEVSLKLLSAEDRRHYLDLAIFAEDVDVPLSALQRVWGLKPFPTTALVQRLGNLSLLRYDLEAGTIRLHDVIRSYLAERLDDAAAVHARLVDAWGDPLRLPDAFAWRWYAYHLVGAGRRERLRELLLDFAWLRAKLEATDPSTVLADFVDLPDDPDLRLVQGAIRLSAHILAKEKAQLRSQLHGRLLPCDTPAIRQLRAQAASADIGPWLRTLAPCLMPPGGALLRTLEGHGGRVYAVAVTPDGRRAISASDDNTLKLWDLDSGQALRTLGGHGGRVYGVAVTPDGRRAVSASADKTLKLWDLDGGQALRTLGGHGGIVYGVAVTPDGRRAVSASSDATLKLWDLGSGQALCTLEGHNGGVNAVAVTPDGRRAVSASADKTLKLWDLDGGQALRTLGGHGGWVNGVAVTPDGRRAVSTSDDSSLKLWDLDGGQALRTLEGHGGRVYGAAVTPDGRRAISASDDKTLKLWDLGSGQALRTLEGHGGRVNAVAVTPDGRRAISASSDATLKLWDLGGGQALRTLEGHGDRVNAVAVTPDGRRAVSASSDTTLKLWDLSSGQALSTLEGHGDRVYGVAVTPDGRRAVSTSADMTLKLWDLGSGQALRTLEGHGGGVNAVAVTPDGRRAISASDDSTLKLWDLGSGQALRTLEGHGGGVNAVAVTPDGRRAVSASADKTLKLWDLDGGALLASFHGEAAFLSCAVTPDGSLFLGGDMAGRVSFLRLEGE